MQKGDVFVFKKSIRFLALLIAVLFVLSCFAGCGKSKGVYNAASKYIKEKSEAVTPSDTESGKENGDSADTPAVSDKTDTSDTSSVADTPSKANSSSKADTSSNQDSENTDSSDKSGNNSSDESVSSVDSSGSNAQSADYGPVVTF